MLDVLTDRTRVTSAVPLEAKRHDAGVGHERRSAAEPFPLWSSAPYVINVLPLKAKVKHRVPCSPTRDCPFELEITFCVRGVVSPLLANIYLHYAFDLWVNVWRKKWAQGEVVVIRYADDVISGFQHQADADRFLENLQERLGKFGLELHPDKTRRIEFGRFAEQNRKRRGEGKPETFDFLGFTHISGKNRLGRFTVRRKTIRKRMRAKLQEIKQQLRERMHDPVRQTGQWLKSVMQGHFHYYAVPGNLDSLGVFRDRVLGHWGHTLRRRSQKRPISWERILALAARWLPPPRVLHPYPAVRFSASHPR
jgi:RNA-directed DNA polymerase